MNSFIYSTVIFYRLCICVMKMKMVFDLVQNWVISILLYSNSLPLLVLLQSQCMTYCIWTRSTFTNKYANDFLWFSWIFALSPIKIRKKSYVHEHTPKTLTDDTYTLANKIFHVSLVRITSICFRKLLVGPILFSHTLSFLLFSFLLVLLLLLSVCVFIDSSSSLMDEWLSTFRKKRRRRWRGETNFCYTTLQCINPDWIDRTKFDDIFTIQTKRKRAKEKLCECMRSYVRA